MFKIETEIFSNKESFEKKHPEAIEFKNDIYSDDNDGNVKENYVYYPWRNQYLRLPSKENYRNIRLSRNRGLIEKKEQTILLEKKIGFLGLNVGNSGAIATALEGGCEYMKFADLDHLSLSNMNRFKSSVFNIGLNKAELTARQILEIDPYYSIDVFDNGISEENAYEFINEPKIDLLVEEMDDLKLKILVRELAREARIPVVMVTGNADKVILDVERYDLDPQCEIMNGLLSREYIDKIYSLKKEEISQQEYGILCRDFIGEQHIDSKLLNAFDRMAELDGIPQLAECTYRRGFALSHTIRSIFLESDRVKSGRYILGDIY